MKKIIRVVLSVLSVVFALLFFYLAMSAVIGEFNPYFIFMQ